VTTTPTAEMLNASRCGAVEYTGYCTTAAAAAAVSVGSCNQSSNSELLTVVPMGGNSAVSGVDCVYEDEAIIATPSILPQQSPPVCMAAAIASAAADVELDPLSKLELTIPPAPLLPPPPALSQPAKSSSTTASRGRLAVFQKLCSSDDSSGDSVEREERGGPSWLVASSSMRPPCKN